MTGTAMEFPIALYRGVSGHSPAGLPRYGTFVQSSGNPCSRSHSRGVSLLTAPHDTIGGSLELYAFSVPHMPSSIDALLVASPMHSTAASARAEAMVGLHSSAYPMVPAPALVL